MNKQITILGLGNLLLKDDGIGPCVVEELQKESLPGGINLVTADGSIYQYLDILNSSRKIIAVDALQSEGPPGTVYILRPEDIYPEGDTCLFRHEDDILGVLKFRKIFQGGSEADGPEFIIVGIEPKEISYSVDLSPELRQKIPEIMGIIRELW